MITPWGGRVVYLASTTSTMDDARVLEEQGEPDGSLVWAGFQTQGRGRHPGRAWHSPPGANLLFTAFWNPDRFRVPSFAPSLTVGLGVCLWLESLRLAPGFPVSLKWPNDVYLGDQKLAGILVRRRWGASGAGSIHAGVGINLQAVDPGAALRTTAVSLKEAGVDLSPGQALEGLLPFLAQAIQDSDPRTLCLSRLWRLGQSFSVTLPDGSPKEGRVQGLDRSGSLQFVTSQGLELIPSVL